MSASSILREMILPTVNAIQKAQNTEYALLHVEVFARQAGFSTKMAEQGQSVLKTLRHQINSEIGSLNNTITRNRAAAKAEIIQRSDALTYNQGAKNRAHVRQPAEQFELDHQGIVNATQKRLLNSDNSPLIKFLNASPLASNPAHYKPNNTPRIYDELIGQITRQLQTDIHTGLSSHFKRQTESLTAFAKKQINLKLQ
jgi:hypothetical protein